MNSFSTFILGLFTTIGLYLLGSTLGDSIIKYKELDRTVIVKGLAQKEVNADTVIWPIVFLRADNTLSKLYKNLENDTQKIVSFLKKNGFTENEITISAPSVTDKLANNYGPSKNISFRYTATQVLTLYTKEVEKSRLIMNKITQLGKAGITFKTNNYENKIEYIFSGLNEIKPQMIKEATKNARASAQTFADDSQSQLGKIKSARQGQFSIMPRDQNTPYIKKVRVVSTIEYYLSD